MENEEVGLGIIAQRLVGFVGVGEKSDIFIRLFFVVADEQREIHGIVGDELGGGGTQHIQLALRPFEFPDVEGEFGVFELRILPDDVGGQVFVHLRIVQRRLPHITHIEFYISKVGLVQ